MTNTLLWIKLSTRLCIALLAISFTAIAQDENRNNGGARLVGTWDAQVTIRNCANGEAIRSFQSIGSFNKGGTSIGSTAGLPQSSRTPEHGVWQHIRGNVYMFRFKSFSFDTAGNSTGWTVVTHRIELDDDDSYTSGGIAQIFAPNGNQVAQGCSTAVGTRFSL